ncbi:hypothetical protein [Dyadobacter pollutisoli]|uniref:Uncharacterized protein n=1 Tax=Dyadobacter pollutisoli TaxID=2910158 RepID=A0A9E8NEU0_9BACT|nr:hypothetical protein [Dyadobacter pollutisoli]WAC12834.1 hypothetical protein ON006_02485 [Dyadobacter pollutisoli]
MWVCSKPFDEEYLLGAFRIESDPDLSSNIALVKLKAGASLIKFRYIVSLVVGLDLYAKFNFPQ